jgi:prepilin-type N-terminal cleavage/methylation domain-containing protein
MGRRVPVDRRSVTSTGGSGGFTILEVMFVVAVMGVLVAIAVPRTLSGLDRSRGLAAARYLASRMNLARAQAVSRSANIALRFEEDARGVRFAVFMDGNGNGVRVADIDAHVDPVVEPPVSLTDLFPGVTITLGQEAGGGGAVPVGASSLLSFSAAGTATPGSIYVRGRDGTQWAVRVLGTTARTRVLRYAVPPGAWVQAF